MKLNNNPRPGAYVNTDGRPTWSPDSTKVAAELGRDVVVVDRNDHVVLNKLGPPNKWSTSPDWSPDGKKIVFSVYDKHRDYKVSSWGVCVANPDGSEQKNLAVDGWEPEWNPQGTKVAFQLTKPHTADHVMIMDADGSNQKIASEGGVFQQDLSWSPGGHQVTYDSVKVDEWQIRITDITGKKDRKLTDGENGVWADRNPEWSPAGNQILFERHDHRFPVNELWVIDPVSKQSKQILAADAQNVDAAWSPDGSRIAFASDRGDGDLDIYVMDADGRNLRQISDLPGHEHAPSWSPDGRAIAFNRFDQEVEREKQHDFHVAELDEKGEARRIKGLLS